MTATTNIFVDSKLSRKKFTMLLNKEAIFLQKYDFTRSDRKIQNNLAKEIRRGAGRQDSPRKSDCFIGFI